MRKLALALKNETHHGEVQSVIQSDDRSEIYEYLTDMI